MDQGQHPPDFSAPGFAGLVDLVMADGRMAREQAIEALNQRWAETHGPPADRGMDGANTQPNGPQQLLPLGTRAGDQDPPPQQPQPPPPAPPNPPQDPPPLPLTEEAPPRGEGAITFNPAAKVVSTLQIRPSDYALKRIEAFKYVPMWYFTREGLQEAAQTVRWSDENKMLAITQAAEGNVTIQAANSLHASKNVKLDHQLSFVDYMYAKNRFLIAIENAKWGNEAVDAFNWFFHNLDNHPLRDEGMRGECALLLYTSCV
ncbi:hypothetical protein ID866_9088 [Astraeus odoratus]|nr:hypothetical protein ID866_9088 [Astraeus odoratus]